MIIIPELELVLITAPRTASGSLRRAIQARYENTIILYHHMEADGVPTGYDRWRRVGFLRNPTERLWSLYKFCRETTAAKHAPYLAALRASVDLPFNDWIVSNQLAFTNPYDSEGTLKFWPMYTVKHSIPENRKSQFVYLRPDLGTEIVFFNHLAPFAASIDVDLPQHNRTDSNTRMPDLTPEAEAHIAKFFAWDTERLGA